MRDVCVQVLPARDAAEDDFDPVFSPPVIDPPRNLPQLITAGTMLPPPASGLQKNASSPSVVTPGERTGDSAESADEGGGTTRRNIGIITGAVALSLLLCVLCALAAVMVRRQQARNLAEGSLDGASSKQRMLRKPRPWEVGAFDHTTDVDSVRRSLHVMQRSGGACAQFISKMQCFVSF